MPKRDTPIKVSLSIPRVLGGQKNGYSCTAQIDFTHHHISHIDKYVQSPETEHVITGYIGLIKTIVRNAYLLTQHQEIERWNGEILIQKMPQKYKVLIEVLSMPNTQTYYPQYWGEVSGLLKILEDGNDFTGFNSDVVIKLGIDVDMIDITR